MLYVAKVCADDPSFGATKLNKILFFSDFISYRKRQRSITGATYQKLKHGPAARCFIPVQKKLIQSSRLAIQEIERYGYGQNRTIALKEPDLTEFSAEEIAMVYEVIQAHRSKNATEISEMSHQFWWEIAEIGEDIPLEVSLVEISGELSPEEQAHAASLEGTAIALLAAA